MSGGKMVTLHGIIPVEGNLEKRENCSNHVYQRGIRMMDNEINEIGENAGHVFRELQKKGSLAVAELKKGCNLGEKEIQRAIGWLAREGNIVFEKEGKNLVVSLRPKE
jgi:hypothetical protein